MRKGFAYSPRCWLAIGTLAAYTAAGSGKIALARLRANNPNTVAAPSADQIANLLASRFDIPAGTLKQVLQAFEAQCAIHAEVSTPGILDLASPGVDGFYTPEQALQKILEKTGVDYTFLTRSSVPSSSQLPSCRST